MQIQSCILIFGQILLKIVLFLLVILLLGQGVGIQVLKIILSHVKAQDTATIRSTELLAWLGIEDLDLILKERRLHWYGQMERSNGAVL